MNHEFAHKNPFVETFSERSYFVGPAGLAFSVIFNAEKEIVSSIVSLAAGPAGNTQRSIISILHTSGAEI